GTKVPEPDRWMEDLNSPKLKLWIGPENAITFKYLDGLPMRDALKKRITELYNYPRVTVPQFEGRHWFYSRNTGLQRQSVVFVRESLTGPERVLIDPNQLSPDGSVALSQYYPSPDGRHFLYGQAEGGSDWSTFYVRELDSGKQLGNPLTPNVNAPVRALYPGHTAAYEPLGVASGTLYMRTDLDAPNSKIVAVPIDKPERSNWKTIVPESKNAIESSHLIAGKL